MPIIEVNDVTKRFTLGYGRSLRETVLDGLARIAGRAAAGPKEFNALDRVSFSIEPGEVVGIIGHNGAGKSTMLKLLAGISAPTTGTVRVSGRVAPLIEVGAGLVAELTGRENIYLNGAILGMARAEIKKKFDEIVSFAELENFIDTPVKRYSSGMAIRLGFAIATSVDADILIVDEVLAVGDLAFQRKCFDRMEALIRGRGKTVLLVSHNLRQVERLCSRVLLLEQGKLLRDGSATRVCNEFYGRLDEKIAENVQRMALRPGRFEISEDVELLTCEVLDEHGRATASIQHGSDLLVRIRVRVRNRLRQPIFGVGFHTTDFVYLVTSQSVGHLNIADLEPGHYELVSRFTRMSLLPGVYSVRVGIALGSQAIPSFYGENLARFQIVSKHLNRAWTTAPNEGFFTQETFWSIRRGHEEVAPLEEVSRTSKTA